ncbi:MAG TPA: exopolysaccharide biosynthesis polyprenyl glycosylphosphotransferase [Firmicutes bacterium]|nr:exopolysaccharide biosynthesis polyprenyl glycosylphosphotransferase [Bacillota bacterium]
MIKKIKEYQYVLLFITAGVVFVATILRRILFREELFVPSHWIDMGVHGILWVIALYYFRYFVVSDLRVNVTFFKSLINSFFMVFFLSLLYRFIHQSNLNRWSADLYKNSIIFFMLVVSTGVAAGLFLKRRKGTVAVIGGGFSGRSVCRELLMSKILRIKIEGFFSDLMKETMHIYDGDEIKEDREKILGKIPWLGEEKCVPAEVARRDIDYLIIAKDLKMSSDLIRNINQLRRSDIRVYYMDEIFETIGRRLPVLHMEKQYFYHIFREIEKKQNEFSLYRMGNRVFNMLSSLLVLLILSPLFALTALIIVLESSGPVFFKQTRVGRYGEPFTLFKFRSMRVHDPQRFPKYSCKGDPRVTCFGKLIRKLRIDEIPQFINILRGEMNLIGPRAEWDVLVDQYEKDIPFYQQRHMIRPGITGWAQVNYHYGENSEDALYKLQYDLYYVKHRSFLLDFKIAIRTIGIMLGAKGQ